MSKKKEASPLTHKVLKCASAAQSAGGAAEHFVEYKWTNNGEIIFFKSKTIHENLRGNCIEKDCRL